MQIYYNLLAATKKIGISVIYCISKDENANIFKPFSFCLLFRIDKLL